MSNTSVGGSSGNSNYFNVMLAIQNIQKNAESAYTQAINTAGLKLEPGQTAGMNVQNYGELSSAADFNQISQEAAKLGVTVNPSAIVNIKLIDTLTNQIKTNGNIQTIKAGLASFQVSDPQGYAQMKEQMQPLMTQLTKQCTAMISTIHLTSALGLLNDMINIGAGSLAQKSAVIENLYNSLQKCNQEKTLPPDIQDFVNNISHWLGEPGSTQRKDILEGFNDWTAGDGGSVRQAVANNPQYTADWNKAQNWINQQDFKNAIRMVLIEVGQAIDQMPSAIKAQKKDIQNTVGQITTTWKNLEGGSQTTSLQQLEKNAQEEWDKSLAQGNVQSLQGNTVGIAIFNSFASGALQLVDQECIAAADAMEFMVDGGNALYSISNEISKLLAEPPTQQNGVEGYKISGPQMETFMKSYLAMTKAGVELLALSVAASSAAVKAAKSNNTKAEETFNAVIQPLQNAADALLQIPTGDNKGSLGEQLSYSETLGGLEKMKSKIDSAQQDATPGEPVFFFVSTTQLTGWSHLIVSTQTNLQTSTKTMQTFASNANQSRLNVWKLLGNLLKSMFAMAMAVDHNI